MFMCKLLSRMTLTLLLSLSVILNAAGPDVLKQVPTNAELVIVSGKISDFESKLADIVSKYGLPDEISFDTFCTEFADELGMEGPIALDKSRSMCFAMTSFMAGENAILVYLPVENPETILAGSNCEKLESGIFKFGFNGYMAAKDKYLAFGTNEGNLKLAVSGPTGVEAPEVTASDMGESDITVLANLANVMNMAKFAVPMGLASAPELQSQPELVAKIQSVVNAVTEVNKLSLALKIDDNGYLAKTNLFYAPGGVLSKGLKPFKKTAVDKLTSMPDGNLMSVSSMSVDPAIMKDMYSFIFNIVTVAAQGKVDGLDEFLNEINSELTSIFDKYADKMGEYVKAEYISDAEGVAPEASVVTLTTSFLDKAEFDNIVSGFVDKKIEGFFEISQYEPKAGKVGSMDYSSFTYSIGQPVPSGEIFKTEVGIYYGEVKPGLFVQCLDESTMADAIEISKNKETVAGNKAFMKTIELLPDSANMYMVMNAGSGMDYMGKAIQAQTQKMAQQNPEMAMQAAMMGPVMSTMSGVKGYVGCAVELEEGYIRDTTFVSKQTVDTFVDAVKNIIQSFMGMQMSGSAGSSTEF